MRKLIAGLLAGLAVALLVTTLGLPTANVVAQPGPFPNCTDSRIDAEYTFLDGSRAQYQRPLCVCAATASGCSAVTVAQCKAYSYWRLKTVAPSQQVCVYALRTNPDAYWAQRITGPTGADSPVVTPAVMPNCTDSRHEAEFTFTDTPVSQTPKPLCVCNAQALGCSAVTTATCKGYAWSRIVTVAGNRQVCVYKHAGFWGQWITDPAPTKPASFTQSCAAVAAAGFKVTPQQAWHRTAAPTPRAGSYAIPGVTYARGPIRNYGQLGDDRVLIDSVPLSPSPGRFNVCKIEVSVKGYSGGVNDHLKLFVASANGLILTGAGWQNGAIVGAMALTGRPGPFTANLTVEATGSMAAPLAAAMAGPVKALDILLLDDSSADYADITYYAY